MVTRRRSAAQPSRGASLSCLSSFFGRSRPFGSGPLGRRSAAQAAALPRRRMVFFGGRSRSSSRRAFPCSRSPKRAVRPLLLDAAVFVTFLDLLGLALLLAGVAGFVAAGHGVLHRLEIFGSRPEEHVGSSREADLRNDCRTGGRVHCQARAVTGP